MIAPSRRLLLIAALVLLPLCTAAGLGLANTAVWAIIFGLLVVCLAVDAWAGHRVSAEFSVAVPEYVRLARERSSLLSIHVMNRASAHRIVKVSLQLPASMQSDREVIVTPPIPKGATVVEQVALTPSQRGDFSITQVALLLVSPAGFWQIHRTQPVALRIRVYPSLRKNQSAAAFYARTPVGAKRFRQIGKGREFEKLRDYNHGDPFDEIHWKASARRGKPIVKVFQVERAQECYVILDNSRLSERNHCLDSFVEATLVLGLAAEKQGDLFGLATFTDHVETFVPAKGGRTHYGRCRDAIYNLAPRPVSADFAELTSFLETRLRKRCLLFLLTSLDDGYLAETLAKYLPLLTRRHIVVVALLQQPGVAPIFSGKEPETVDDIYSSLAGHWVWQTRRELRQKMKSQGAEVIFGDAGNIHRQLAEAYTGIKQRQLL